MAPLEQAELFDLCDEILERMDKPGLMQAITRANRTGDLQDLLASLNMSGLLGEQKDDPLAFTSKVIVLGASEVKEDKLRSIIRKKGLDPNRFEFQLEYDHLKHFDFGKLRHSMGYAAILVGPMPHSTPGKLDSSSFSAEVKNNPGLYPPMHEMRSGDELKITNNSFKAALGWLTQIGA